ncbi:related to C6 transcription factor [Cephalotrichum gorgonifer]|uniref:Related to C6 transcription factor n=1 Tax=Cephalotrichum gorgonifer TaxID=2041049 RepID=A0AAE8SX52_9PEZI|nr:related to C6 transcription factor [Cephalotrichum gorgonifer]
MSSSTKSTPDPGPNTRISKRHYPKTKTGCRTCKRRKIKCDEERPSCRNCLKHNVDCDFLPASRPLGVPSTTAAPGSDSMNLLDLELLLNYANVTFATFSHDRILQDFWKHVVPRMGLQCDFVMRSVLAISALHIAFHRPEKREFYISTALRYHQLASRKAMHLLGNVTQESADELFVFSVLTICVALGSPRKADGTLLVGESSCPEWMALLMGTKSIIDVMGDRMWTGPLSPLFQRGRERREQLFMSAPKDAERYSNTMEAFDHLLDLLRRMVLDEGLLRTYSKAVRLLRETAHLLDQPQRAHISDVFRWVWQVGDDFLPLLQIPTQEAVAIFAHFCVYLKVLEGQWWLMGWADHLISRAWDMLDEEHRLWIRWPVDEIGWVPP